MYHIPALLKETVDGLVTRPDGVYVDATFGGGGHSREVLTELGDNGRLFSIDQDIETIENAAGMNKDRRWRFIHGNFRYIRNYMDYYGIEYIDGVLADIGVSFHHFDEPLRGFSFRFDCPLDMRMNTNADKNAADVVNGYSEDELADIFYLYGEMKNARSIAKKIVKVRSAKPISTTYELVNAAGYSLYKPDKKELAQLFQALRIEVNDELGALRQLLLSSLDLLAPGGRIAVLTYHSLEDRIVKNFFRSGNLEGRIEKDFYGNILTPFRIIEKGLSPSDSEIESNPRARSAKLRIAEKTV